MPKIEQLEPEWINDDALKLYKAVEAERDRIYEQFRIDLGDLPEEKLDHELSATDALIRQQRRRVTPERRAEIAASYQRLFDGFNKQLADIFSKYAHPRVLITKDD